MGNSTLPTSSTAVSRYGQMTPPRSNSAASTDSAMFEEKLSPKSITPEEPSRSCKVPDEQEGKDRTTTARLAREGHSECIPEGPSHAHEGSGPANECSPARPCEL